MPKSNQLSSIIFQPTAMFPSFQDVTGTTLSTVATLLTKPSQILGAVGAGVRAIYENTPTCATTLCLKFALTTADNVKAAVRVVTLSKTTNGLWLPTEHFLGEVQAGSFDISTAVGEATAFACDNFSLKTKVSPYVNYVEPTINSGFAELLIDIRGEQLVVVDLAAGAATAAAKVQIWYGVN